jgi:hypothetical protein
MSYSVEFITSELTRWDTLVRAAVREGSIVALMKTLKSPIVSLTISVVISELNLLQRKFYRKCVLLAEGPEKAAFDEPYYLHEVLLTCGKDLDRPFLLEDLRAVLTVFDQPANQRARAGIENAGTAPGPSNTQELAQTSTPVNRTPLETSKDIVAAPTSPGSSRKTDPATAKQTHLAMPEGIRPRPIGKGTKKPEEDVMAELTDDGPVAKFTTGERWPTAMYKEIVAAAAARRPELIRIRRSVDSASDEDVAPVGFGVLNADTPEQSESDAPAKKRAAVQKKKDKGKGRAVERGGDSEDFEMEELEEDMANTKIVVKRKTATAAGTSGVRIRYRGQPTGKLFARPCQKCENARVDTVCQVDAKGGACVRCKSHKYKCDYAFRPGGEKKSKQEVESEDDESDVQASQSDVARTSRALPARPIQSGGARTQTAMAERSSKRIRFELPERTDSPPATPTVRPSSSSSTAPKVFKRTPASKSGTVSKSLSILPVGFF